MEEVKTARAHLKYARISPRKVKIVCDLIRGKRIKTARRRANSPAMPKRSSSIRPSVRVTAAGPWYAGSSLHSVR